MNKVVIISPHFPPVNAADMHRVRQSVWYFESLGWDSMVICVDEKYVETSADELLLQSIPNKLKIYKTKAFSTSWTRKLGLGALALRSLYFYLVLGNKVIKEHKPDLIYFSTTQFPVLVLGRFWKWKFKVPYVIDMQDPWHSDYYKLKPKHERPPKYWFSYHLNKFLEPIAMKNVDGIISVSQGYCDLLQSRYKSITPENCIVIPFGAFAKDFEIKGEFENKDINRQTSNSIIVRYIGRGGADMHTSLSIFFKAFQIGLERRHDLFSRIKFEFIGTSYAAAGKGIATILPLAQKMGLESYVSEITNRIPYFEALHLLKEADLLVIPGSDDPNYTASKLYPYILAKKPILAVFSSSSSVVDILENTNAGEFVSFNLAKLSMTEEIIETLYQKWLRILNKLPFVPETNWIAFEPYTSLEMSKKQVQFFNQILEKKLLKKDKNLVK